MTPTSTPLTNRAGERSEAGRKTMKEVTVVRLRREQREKVAILSSREKYNYAVSCFQPVITYLQNIGSAKFYPALSFWEKLVRQGLNADTQHQNELGCETDDSSDTLSIIDPVDLAAMINDVASWQAPNNSDSSGDPDPEILMQKVFGIDFYTGSSFSRPMEGTNCDVTECVTISHGEEDRTTSIRDENNRSSDAHADNATEQPGGQVASPPPVVAINDRFREGGLDEMNLPAPIVRGKPKQEKVLYWASKASLKRRTDPAATVVAATTDVIELVQWAKHTMPLEKVGDILDRFPVNMTERAFLRRTPLVDISTKASAQQCSHAFVIPEVLVKSLSATLLAKTSTHNQNAVKLEDDHPQAIIDVDSSQGDATELVAKFKASGPHFSRCVCMYVCKND